MPEGLEHESARVAEDARFDQDDAGNGQGEKVKGMRANSSGPPRNGRRAAALIHNSPHV